MTGNPKDEKTPPGGDREKERKERKEAPGLGALRNIFGRMAFEKGPAYRDEPKEDEEDLGQREGLWRPGPRRRRKDRKGPGPGKPPEAFPGP